MSLPTFLNFNEYKFVILNHVLLCLMIFFFWRSSWFQVPKEFGETSSAENSDEYKICQENISNSALKSLNLELNCGDYKNFSNFTGSFCLLAPCGCCRKAK